MSSLVPCSPPQKCLHRSSFLALFPSFPILLSTNFQDKDMRSLHVSSLSGLQPTLVIFSFSLSLISWNRSAVFSVGGHGSAGKLDLTVLLPWGALHGRWQVLVACQYNGHLEGRHIGLLRHVTPAELISARKELERFYYPGHLNLFGGKFIWKEKRESSFLGAGSRCRCWERPFELNLAPNQSVIDCDNRGTGTKASGAADRWQWGGRALSGCRREMEYLLKYLSSARFIFIFLHKMW